MTGRSVCRRRYHICRLRRLSLRRSRLLLLLAVERHTARYHGMRQRARGRSTDLMEYREQPPATGVAMIGCRYPIQNALCLQHFTHDFADMQFLSVWRCCADEAGPTPSSPFGRPAAKYRRAAAATSRTRPRHLSLFS